MSYLVISCGLKNKQNRIFLCCVSKIMIQLKNDVVKATEHKMVVYEMEIVKIASLGKYALTLKT